MSQADREKWNGRFTGKPLVAPTAPDFIVECEPLLPVGHCLDLAAGDGASALYLAGNANRQVTAVDIAEQGLQRCQHFAQAKGASVDILALDLDEPDLLGLHFEAGSIAVITFAHFKPSPELFLAAVSLLQSGGHLLLTTFNQRHHVQNGFSKRFCLEPEEYLKLSDELDVLSYQSLDRDGDYMDDYHFMRR